MRSVHSTDFVDQIANIVETLQENATEELEVNFTLRILIVLTLALERATPSQVHRSVLEDLSRQHVVPATKNENALVRQAAIRATGMVGLFSDPAEQDLQPVLMEVAQSDTETMEIRIQALLAMSDCSLLLGSADDAFRQTVTEMLDHKETTVVMVAAEIATKLLLSGLVRDSDWLARLMALYFDPNSPPQDDEDVDNAGSATRVQQLLTIFFPAYSSLNQVSREAFTGCIAPLLELLSSLKRKKRWPVSKMLDYVVSNAEQGREQAGSCQEESSPSLLAAIQVAQYVAKEGSDLTKTQLRAFCKFLGTCDLDVETDKKEHVKLLISSMEEVGMVITDDASLNSLVPLNELLETVNLDEQTDQSADESAEEQVTEEEGQAAEEEEAQLTGTENEQDRESLLSSKTRDSAGSRRSLEIRSPNQKNPFAKSLRL
jgi:hypothetical protein